MTAVGVWLGKSALCLAIGLLMLPCLRRASAALRHAVITTAVLGACLMPVLIWITPDWPVVSAVFARTDVDQPSLVDHGATGTGGVTLATTAGTADATGPTLANTGLAVWLVASLVVGIRAARSRRRVAALLRDAEPLGGEPAEALASLTQAWRLTRPVRLLAHPTASLVAVAGVWRPRIIVPAAAATWSRDRWQVVLRHELAHVRRWDLGWRVAAQCLTLSQPWNPLAWLAARRIDQTSEQACDDIVITSGIAATDYATHLLDIARSIPSPPAGRIAASSIAHPSTLERRVHAMLHPHTNHRSLTRAGLALATTLSLVAGLSLAAATTAAEPIATPAVVSLSPAIPAPALPVTVTTPASAPRVPVSPRRPARQPAVPAQSASITGRVADQTGGTIPGATVTLMDPAGATTRAVTNAAGKVTFDHLLAGRYELTITLPGFKTARSLLTVADGQSVEPVITLEVGAVAESITVACSTPTPLDVFATLLDAVMPTVHAQGASTPIRVGGNVRPPRRTRYVAPTCPGGAGSREGTVGLKARIDATGHVVDVVLAPGAAAARDLTEAVLEAIRQWEYTPTMLNGQPIAVELSVTVRFGQS